MTHITKDNVELVIRERGWTYSPWYQSGGWINHDVRDNDGELIVFDSAADVAEYIGLEIEE